MKIIEVMIKLENVPVVLTNLILKEAFETMNIKEIGVVCITDNEGYLKGILTDGDIRRKLLKEQKPLSSLFIDDCIDHANKTPITISSNKELTDALAIMVNNKVWDLPVLDNQGKLLGLLHLHQVIKSLIKI